MALFSIVINEIKVSWFSLAFPVKLEKDFLQDYLNKSLIHTRIALLLAIFFYGIFGFLDAWLVPEEKLSLWFIRYVVFIPYTALIALFSFSKNFKNYMQAANSSVVLLAGFGIIGMILIAPAPVSNSYYAGLILVFIFGYTFFKLRFIWATLTGWLIVVAYEITAVLLSDTSLLVLINNNFFFLTGNILGMFACYSIEFYLRKEFIQSRMLDTEKSKVNAANLQLEKKVAERTSQLVIMNKDLEREISERKHSAEALRMSEEKYRSILESMQEGYFEVDLTGKLIFFNESAAKILGYSMQEMTNLDYRDYTNKKTAEKMFQAFNRLYTSGKSVNVMDYGVVRKDGGTRILSMSTSLIRNQQGEPDGFRGVARDDTARKRAEERIRQMNDELERRVEKRTAQLNETNLVLKQSLATVKKTQDRLVQTEKMASLGSLVAGVAHEINTPVGIGVTASSLLEEKTRQINSLHASGEMKRSDLEKYLKTANDASASILLNLNQAADLIRSFKQVAVDQSNEERRSFRVKEYINNVLLSLRPKLKKTEHHVQVECPENLKINSYPGAFSQIVTNLVMNSLLHGFSGIDRGEIQIKFSKTDADYLLTYSDNGVGMDANTYRNIFDPFFTTKRATGGTGLGMHIVFNLVTQTLNGKINCKSAPGKGTFYAIKIPSEQEI
jgi:PAS domain S-box-containing protein